MLTHPKRENSIFFATFAESFASSAVMSFGLESFNRKDRKGLRKGRKATLKNAMRVAAIPTKPRYLDKILAKKRKTFHNQPLAGPTRSYYERAVIIGRN
jgi:hypothetical protein